jgi:DNA-binding transcriptional regulator YhcF (GntR family)
MEKDGFIRSVQNKGAVINTDDSALNAYRKQRATFMDLQKNSKEINKLKNEIGQIKEDISSIKELIIKALSK